MKNKALAILMTALLLGSTLLGCNQKYDETATKQEQTMKKQSKEEGKAKKQNKDRLVSDTKKDSKLAKEDSTKKEKNNNPKESADKKDNVEQKQGKENKTEIAKSESKPKETTKPSSNPTENEKPSNNPTSKPTSKPETKPQNNSTPKPQHTHNWVAQTHDEFHDAITHTETVVIEEAWDEEVFAGEWSCCNVCGADITGNESEHIYNHMVNGEGGRYHSEIRWETKHHPAVTEERVVVDKPAWTEKVVDGYQCSCGATK